MKENQIETQVVAKQLYLAAYSDTSFIQKPKEELFTTYEPKKISIQQLKEILVELSGVFTNDIVKSEVLIDFLIHLIVIIS